MRSLILSLLAAAALFCSLLSANAVTVYGTAYIGGGPATLYTIDPNTGIATPVGSGIGYDRVGAIDFDPTTGILYGIGSNQPNIFSLITINTTTGVGTTVGDGVPNFQDINFRSDGTLFGLGGANIWTINLTNGATTLVGFTGFQGNGNGLAFDPSDTLYRISNADIFTISQMDGNATDTGTNVNYPVALLNPRTNAMDYDLTTGTLYASVVSSDERANPTNFIAEIDLATGNVSNALLTVTGLDGLAVLPQQPTPPPNGGVPETGGTLFLMSVAAAFLIGLKRVLA